MMRVLTDDPRFTPLHHAIGHGELIDWAAVHEGSDARRRHSAMVHGLCGVGSEAARLLMLCGLTRVVLNDDTPVTHEDLNTQLLLTDADVGRRRSEALAERLAVAFDGISTTEVTAVVGPLPDPESVEDSKIGVIIATTAVSSMRELADFADGLRETSCVCALAHGAFAFVHASRDTAVLQNTAGELRRFPRVASKPPPPPALVESVTKLDDGAGGSEALNAYAVTTCEATPHGLVAGDRVELVAKRTGEEQKNEKLAAPGPTATVSASTGTHSFTATLRLPDDAFSPGDCEYVRWVGSEALRLPDDASSDASSLGKALGSGLQKLKDGSSDGLPSHVTLRYSDDAAVAPALVLALRELDALEPGDDPCAWAGELFDEVQNKFGWLENPTDRCREAVSELARGCKVRIPAVCTVAASLATHRALRALTRAGGVDDGWIVYDCVEMIVPISQNANVSSRVVAPPGTEGARILLGSDAVDVLGSMLVTLAGAGGIGREVLRLLALAGVGKCGGGRVDVVDAADVFKHDLARGSLLRAGDAGANKAVASVAAVAQLCAARVNHARVDDATVARTEGSAAPDDAVGSPGGVAVSPLKSRLASDDAGQPGDDTWTSHMAWLGRGDGTARYDATRLEGVDAIVSCVDSLADRRAIDELSCRTRCALLDAGCDGDAVSCHVAVPHRTMPWSHGPRDAPEWEPPSCVLGNFPHAWVHAARWAKDLFVDLFVDAPRGVNAYLRDSTYAEENLDASSSSRDLGSRLRDLRRIHAGLVRERPYEYSHCVRWAAARFRECFTRLPSAMLKNFPPAQTQRDGSPFWSGTKRVPAPIAFDANTPSHVTFVVAAANLRAEAYGLRGSLDPDAHATIAAASESLRETKIEEEESAEEDEAARVARDEATCASLLAQLPARETLVGFRVREAPEPRAGSREPLAAAFIAAAASLRADVHRICKPIGDADGDAGFGSSGSSSSRRRGDDGDGFEAARECVDWLGLTATGAKPGTPAAAALAGALVAIEAHKLAAVKASRLRDEEEKVYGVVEGETVFARRPFRHTYASLGDWSACVSASCAPVDVKVAKTGKGDLRWSVWDVLEMDCTDGVTLAGFIERFELKVGLACSAISHGASLVYADFMNRAKIEDRLRSRLFDALKLGPEATHATLSVGACDENDDDVEIPDVRVRFR